MVLDCVTSLQHGADLLWIETPIPNLSKIASLVSAIRAQVKILARKCKKILDNLIE